MLGTGIKPLAGKPASHCGAPGLRLSFAPVTEAGMEFLAPGLKLSQLWLLWTFEWEPLFK